MKYWLVLFCFFETLVVSAQTEISRFGEVTRAELEMKECVFEKDAPALKLFDLTEVELEVFETARITLEKRVRIKIFNEEGFKFANVRIPYFGEKRSTKIKDFAAIIYYFDEKGNIVSERVEKKDVFKEAITDKAKSLTFTFPHVKKGCVIEYRYTKIEKKEVSLDPWILQDAIPTAYTAAWVTIPDRGYMQTKVFGFDSIPFKTEMINAWSNYPKERRYYKKENIPSFKSETFMSSSKDNLLKMVFEVHPKTFMMRDPEIAWKAIATRLLRSLYFGEQIKLIIPGTQAIIDSAKKINPLSSRIEYLYERVRKQIPEVSGQIFLSEDIAAAWQEKNGTSADVNLILLNFLKKADVPCYPLLISTRENGMVAMDFPSLSQINGVDVIAFDSLQHFILDASQKQSYSLPPADILNRNVYLIDSVDMKWIYVEDKRTLLTTTARIIATMDEEGMIKGDADFKLFDYARATVMDTTSNEDSDKLFASRQVGVKVHSVTNENLNSLNEPVVQKVRFDYEPNNDGSFFYFNPQFLNNQDKNPFIKKERRTDIDFGYNQKMSVEIQLNIPKGFSFEHLPPNVRMRSADTTMSFSRMIFTDEQTLVYRQDFEIKRPFFFKEEYKGVHEFFEKMFSYIREEIVIRKK